MITKFNEKAYLTLFVSKTYFKVRNWFLYFRIGEKGKSLSNVSNYFSYLEKLPIDKTLFQMALYIYPISLNISRFSIICKYFAKNLMLELRNAHFLVTF